MLNDYNSNSRAAEDIVDIFILHTHNVQYSFILYSCHRTTLCDLKHFKKIFNFSVVRKLFVMVLLGYYHILNIHGPERDLGWGDKGARRAQEY